MSTRMRVLIVDDDFDVRLGLRSLLRALGHQVEEAENGTEGLRQILATRPDVALIDLGMEQGLDGYELVAALRASADGASLRLVALTGRGRREDRMRALAVGFDAYLVKPVSESELIAALEGRAAP